MLAIAFMLALIIGTAYLNSIGHAMDQERKREE